MAAGAFDDGGVPAPEREIKNPPPNPHTDLYLVRRFDAIELALQKNLLVNESIKEKIDSQSVRIERISTDIIENGKKLIEIETKLNRVMDDYKTLDNRLDKVRTLVFGAVALTSVLALLLPPLIAKTNFFGLMSAAQGDQPRGGRR